MTQEINHRLTLALGKCWTECDACCEYDCLLRHREHEFCPLNPDYSGDPRLVIKAMREMEDWGAFSIKIGHYSWQHYYIREDLIMDREGKLAKLVLEWIEGRK